MIRFRIRIRFRKSVVQIRGSSAGSAVPKCHGSTSQYVTFSKISTVFIITIPPDLKPESRCCRFVWKQLNKQNFWIKFAALDIRKVGKNLLFVSRILFMFAFCKKLTFSPNDMPSQKSKVG